jgi:uncharacterized SAM-binding protein YcdF (DUF218 family)
MPPAPQPPGGRLRRAAPLLIVLFVTVPGAYGFVELGAFLSKEDPLQKADAIMVLAGSSMQRPLEAADLYLAGYSPRIVLTRETRDKGERVLLERGIAFAEDVARVRNVFLQLGIPDAAILVPARIHDSTAAEAITLRQLALQRGWQNVIVVSSKYHLRRAGFALRRELRGTGVLITMRATRYDEAEPGRWWQRRADVRDIMSELPKLVAYVVGLGA